MIKINNKSWSFDIEATGLINNSTVDYSVVPFKFRKSVLAGVPFKVHCVIFRNMVTQEVVSFLDYNFKDMKQWIINNVELLAGHNIINYDLMVLKSYFGIDYSFRMWLNNEAHDTLCGKPVMIYDTFLMSNFLNPERPKHSLEYFGEKLGEGKIDWRGEAIELGLIKKTDPKGAEFWQYHEKMKEYCVQDTKVSDKLFKYLIENEIGEWNWTDCIALEQYTAWVVSQYEHWGFWFNKDLAEENIKELDSLLRKTEEDLEPVMPMMPLTQAALNSYTPPKNQFLKNGNLSSHMVKFMERHDIKIIDEDYVEYQGTRYKLPLAAPLKTERKVTPKDSAALKSDIISKGWKPSEWAMDDLTVKKSSAKEGKRKRTREEFEQAVERYLKKAEGTAFEPFKLSFLKVKTIEEARQKMLAHDISKPLRILTSPKYTEGQDKRIDKNLQRLGSKVAYVEQVVKYLTYSHRRNFILGGGLEYEEAEDEQDSKGVLTYVKDNGRIPTPALTCSANSGRFKHKVVANCPRVSSLYGWNMRGMFGVNRLLGEIQCGYDFSSLENRVQAHYCQPYDIDGYCNSLIQDKPFDSHTLMCEKMNRILDGCLPKPLTRDITKNLSYGIAYGAQPKKVSDMLGVSEKIGKMAYDAYWEAAKPLALFKEKQIKEWINNGKKFITGLDGRKIFAKAEHTVVNYTFQSAGAIIAKATMCVQHYLLKRENLVLDFWKETLDKPYVQFMIAYHKN